MTRRTLFKHVLSAFAGSVLARMPLAGPKVDRPEVCSLELQQMANRQYEKLLEQVQWDKFRDQGHTWESLYALVDYCYDAQSTAFGMVTND